jgi:hypothetical protein
MGFDSSPPPSFLGVNRPIGLHRLKVLLCPHSLMVKTVSFSVIVMGSIPIEVTFFCFSPGLLFLLTHRLVLGFICLVYSRGWLISKVVIYSIS